MNNILSTSTGLTMDTPQKDETPHLETGWWYKKLLIILEWCIIYAYLGIKFKYQVKKLVQFTTWRD